MCFLTACIEILCGPLLISHWSLFGLGSLINFTHVLTNYILPFEKIGNTELFEAKLISWRLGEQSGRRIKSFANDRRCDLLLSLCFLISCWGGVGLRRVDTRNTTWLYTGPFLEEILSSGDTNTIITYFLQVWMRIFDSESKLQKPDGYYCGCFILGNLSER